MNWHSQDQFDIRFEWGIEAAKHLSKDVDVVIIVDVLSFSTCVDLAVSRKAVVYPFHFKDSRSKAYAESLNSKLANPIRSKTELCLSPATMKYLNAGDKMVLPSPNGSSISFAIENLNVLCGSTRNAKSVAEHAMKLGSKILVIAAGEKWSESDSLRPAIEDQIGAGAILSKLVSTKSPEALGAIAVFKYFESDLLAALNNSSTGRELIERGYPEDVKLAAEFNTSTSVPVLINKAFQNAIENAI